MYCKKCGKELFSAQKFCPACGSEVSFPPQDISAYIALPEAQARHGCIKDIAVDGCALPTRLYLHSPKGKPFIVKSTILMNIDGARVEKPLSVQVAIVSTIPKKRSVWRWLWIPLAALATILLLMNISGASDLFDTLSIEDGIVYDEPDPYK